MRTKHMDNTQRRVPKEHRKLGGKLYIYYKVYSKREGEEKARNLRKNAGINVRLVPWGGQFALYMRNPHNMR